MSFIKNPFLELLETPDTRSEKTEKNDHPPVEKYFPARKRLTNIRSHNNPQAAQIC